uniref:Uncharacterized protein n=2 Tax=Caenorhabditis japonica TaxID=281687 RepID=A0A8R1DZ45_CAEJA
MDTEYFQTPEFLSIAFHILTFFEVPIHSFGTYCILFRTPDSMRSVKWSMLNLQFWSMSLDFGISLMTSPFVLFPAVAGFPLGILKEFGVSTAAQIYLIVVLFASEFHAGFFHGFRNGNLTAFHRENVNTAHND